MIQRFFMRDERLGIKFCYTGGYADPPIQNTKPVTPVLLKNKDLMYSCQEPPKYTCKKNIKNRNHSFQRNYRVGNNNIFATFNF